MTKRPVSASRWRPRRSLTHSPLTCVTLLPWTKWEMSPTSPSLSLSLHPPLLQWKRHEKTPPHQRILRRYCFQKTTPGRGGWVRRLRRDVCLSFRWTLWVPLWKKQRVSAPHLPKRRRVTPGRPLSRRVLPLRRVQLPPRRPPSARGEGGSGGSHFPLTSVAAESRAGGGQPPAAARPEEGEGPSHSSAPGAEAGQNQDAGSPRGSEERGTAGRPKGGAAPTVGSGTTASVRTPHLWPSSPLPAVANPRSGVVPDLCPFALFFAAKKAADESKSDGLHPEESASAASLPPFNPHSPVGKTGVA